jgi:tRNA (guanine37-N1)-methyltransferase
MLSIDVITLFPNLFDEHLNNLPFKKAIDNELIEVNLHNLRDFAVDKHGTVDDRPYGGGVGMLLMVEPIYKALQKIYGKDFLETRDKNASKIIVLSPKGETHTQKKAENYKNLKQITFICGRYEGIDARISEYLADEVVSIGNYVLSGGELPTLVVMESIVRRIPDVLEKKEAGEIESFSEGNNVEFPQYTRPQEFKGMKVPDILLSGHHENIKKWRKDKTKK